MAGLDAANYDAVSCAIYVVTLRIDSFKEVPVETGRLLVETTRPAGHTHFGGRVRIGSRFLWCSLKKVTNIIPLPTGYSESVCKKRLILFPNHRRNQSSVFSATS